MTEKSITPSSGTVSFKLVWQAALVVALVAIAWIVAQTLPGMQRLGDQADKENNQAAGLLNPATVRFYSLPKVGNAAALQEINSRVAAAQKEVLVAARQLAASSLLTNLKTRQSAGVKTIVLLSPDMTTDFARSKLFEWLRDNQMKDVYRDTMTSASHLIVIDAKTVIVSDLPLSQRAYEAPDEATARAAALGFLYIIDDANLAAQMAEALRQRALVQNKIL